MLVNPPNSVHIDPLIYHVGEHVNTCYMLTNMVNQRVYVGQTQDLQARMRSHGTTPVKGMQADVLAMGWDVFKLTVIQSG